MNTITNYFDNGMIEMIATMEKKGTPAAIFSFLVDDIDVPLVVGVDHVTTADDCLEEFKVLVEGLKDRLPFADGSEFMYDFVGFNRDETDKAWKLVSAHVDQLTL